MVAELQKMPRRYAKAEALKIVKQHVQGGRLVITNHGNQRQGQRKIDTRVLKYVLLHGNIIDEPEPDIGTNNWKYKIKGKSLEDDKIEVVVTIENNEVRIITCY